MKSAISLLALLTTTMSFGCASLTFKSDSNSKKKDKSWFSFSKKEYQIPQSINVTWVHDVYTIPGKVPTRGFGGRFYFYNEKSQAIPVDGDLMVYGFDDTYGTADLNNLNSAAKRFKFTAEQLTNHFDEGQLGASYSVWIPWDAAPGDQKKIMLIPTFMAKDGRLVRGSAATLLLPGRTPETVEPNTTTILQVSGNGNQNALPAVATNMTSPLPTHPGITTINMPRRGAAVQSKSLPTDLVAQFENIQSQHDRELRERIQQIPVSSVTESTHITAPPPTMQPQLNTTPLIAPPANQFLFNPTIQGVSAPTTRIEGLTTGSNMASNNGPSIGATSLPPQSHSLPSPPPAPTSAFAPPVSYQQLLQPRQ